jgi:hypothetical protein
VLGIYLARSPNYYSLEERKSVGSSMPEISRFFGIIIRMYMEPNQPHHRPHFHAYYHENAAIYAIDEIELIAGELPRRQRRLVEAWAELHLSELRSDWERLQTGQVPVPIDPLK